MNYALRDKIAQYMWHYLGTVNKNFNYEGKMPEEFEHMAFIAMQLTVQEIDAMLLELMKSRLEDCLKND